MVARRIWRKSGLSLKHKRAGLTAFISIDLFVHMSWADEALFIERNMLFM
jgi:hypothetical protein